MIHLASVPFVFQVLPDSLACELLKTSTEGSPYLLLSVRPISHSQRLVSSSMYSKHILNAQVSIRAPCCKQWFDCSECHAETQTHPLAKTNEMSFICKKCKKAFRKDMTSYEESDEYCPHCDNHYVRVFGDYCRLTFSDRVYPCR
jgi:uncharacterized CHY-type Zn-finger protein